MYCEKQLQQKTSELYQIRVEWCPPPPSGTLTLPYIGIREVS
jgi:hypothetical protein